MSSQHHQQSSSANNSYSSGGFAVPTSSSFTAIADYHTQSRYHTISPTQVAISPNQQVQNQVPVTNTSPYSQDIYNQVSEIYKITYIFIYLLIFLSVKFFDICKEKQQLNQFNLCQLNFLNSKVHSQVTGKIAIVEVILLLVLQLYHLTHMKVFSQDL